MTDDDVLRHVTDRLLDFEPTGTPVRLPEGNLNVVWRVPGQPEPVIVKFAPPYIAANPDVPLDPSRLEVEANALHALASGSALNAVCTEHVRPPHPIGMHADPHVLIMEDVGVHPTLGRWLRSADATLDRAAHIGRQTGQFIGHLHAATVERNHLSRQFDNRAMQETRLAVQYEAVEEMLLTAGVEGAASLGERAVALGEKLLEPGVCLTMGDLWPPSVLVTDKGLRIIDWELAHYGHPMQDIAHVAAHGWMQAHRAPSESVATASQVLLDALLAAYREALGDMAGRLLTPQVLEDGAVHLGAEILVRTVGSFQAGYVYEGLGPASFPVQEAVEVAVEHLRRPATVGTFDALRGVGR